MKHTYFPLVGEGASARNIDEAVADLNEVLDQGKDPAHFLAQWGEPLRDLLIDYQIDTKAHTYRMKAVA